VLHKKFILLNLTGLIPYFDAALSDILLFEFFIQEWPQSDYDFNFIG